MRKIYLFVLIIVGLLIIFILYLSSNKESVNEIENMEHITAFPTQEDSVYLSNPVNITLSDSSVFISDQGSSKISVFDHNGNFKKSIGQKGSGPKEFRMLGKIEYQNQKLYVNDIGNGRFLIIRLDSMSYRTLFPEQLPTVFAVGSENIFMDYFISGNSNKQQYPLIWKYDDKMNKQSAFGHRLRLFEEMPPVASSYYISILENTIYVLFEYYPILRKYNSEGNLLEIIELDDLYRGRIEQNYDKEVFANPQVLNLQNLYTGFDVNKRGVFFTVFEDDQLIIDHFDHQGNFKKRYNQSIIAETYYVRDLKVKIGKEGRLRFYILNLTNSYPKVDIYQGHIGNQETGYSE